MTLIHTHTHTHTHTHSRITTFRWESIGLCLSMHWSIYKSVCPHLPLPLWAVLQSRLPFCLSICLSIHLPVCPSKPSLCLSTCLSICLSLSNYYIWLSVLQSYCFDHTAVITVCCTMNHFQVLHVSIWVISICVTMYLLSI